MIEKSTTVNEQIDDTQEKKGILRNKWVIAGLGTIAIIAGYFWLKDHKETLVETTKVESPAPKCADSWEMPGLPHPNGNYIDKGIDRIIHVDNKIDPKDILKDDWLGQIAKDKVLLEHTGEKFAQYGENKKIDIDQNALVDDQGCATELAETTVNNIKQLIDDGKENYARTPWYYANSFVDTKNNDIDYSAVTKDNQAIRIIFKKTKQSLDVEGICGNIVEPRTQPVIKSEEKDSNKETNNDNDDKEDEKDKKSEKKPQLDPSQTGNAPTGSGTNINKGPGTLEVLKKK